MNNQTILPASTAAALMAALVRAMADHDRETAEHLKATARIAEGIARALRLRDRTVIRCRHSALLHDIGKLDLDVRILRKPGPLTREEWNEVMLHPEKGEAILAAIPELAHLARIVGTHHERVDGHGYPNRLIGDEIPIESRVIAVADAFHAMTCWRPYRKTLPVAEALFELAANAGTQFDPRVVAAFTATFGAAERRATVRRTTYLLATG